MTVPREEISRVLEPLYEPYKEDISALADRSKLFGMRENDRKEKFSIWVKQIYRELFDNPMAKIIVKIVSCSSEFQIVYMPEQDNVSDIENTGNAEFIVEGVTYGRVEEIYIAAKHYENKVKRDRLKGLIIHEFCHFAVYETFGNGYNAFYLHDKPMKVQWDEALQECLEARYLERLIDEMLDGYDESKYEQELVVRYFQYQIEHQFDVEKLERFREFFPKLCQVCEEYVFKNFSDEYEKICAIREINKTVTLAEGSPYLQNAIICKMNYNPSYENQIIKSNYTALMANYIFYKFKRTQNFKAKYVFVNVAFLCDSFEKFELAAHRLAGCTFVIDCDSEHLANIKSKLENIVKEIQNSKIIVMLGYHQSFEFKGSSQSEINFYPSHLAEEFCHIIKVNFQDRDVLLTDLIGVEIFWSLKNLPTDLLFKARVSIGNQKKQPIRCDHYVERNIWHSCQGDELLESSDGSTNYIENVFTSFKRILISNEPGMGKSVESVEMYYRFKKIYQDNWIVHMNLSEYLKNSDSFVSGETEQFKTFFYEKVLKLTPFETDIFNVLLQYGRVIIILDGLDEIVPKHLQNIKHLLASIFSIYEEQRMIIFARPQVAREMAEFRFEAMKIGSLEVEKIDSMILKVLQGKGLKRNNNDINKKLLDIKCFLSKHDLVTPLLIRMITEASLAAPLNSDFLKISDIFFNFTAQYDSTIITKFGSKITMELDFEQISDNYAVGCLIVHKDGFNEKFQLSKKDLQMFIGCIKCELVTKKREREQLQGPSQLT